MHRLYDSDPQAHWSHVSFILIICSDFILLHIWMLQSHSPISMITCTDCRWLNHVHYSSYPSSHRLYAFLIGLCSLSIRISHMLISTLCICSNSHSSMLISPLCMLQYSSLVCVSTNALLTFIHIYACCQWSSYIWFPLYAWCHLVYVYLSLMHAVCSFSGQY